MQRLSYLPCFLACGKNQQLQVAVSCLAQHQLSQFVDFSQDRLDLVRRLVDNGSMKVIAYIPSARRGRRIRAGRTQL